MLLVLNMIDLARRRGIVFDLDRLSSELGVPVVTSTAVRRGGIDDLLPRIDDWPASRPPRREHWRPRRKRLRAPQREADRIIPRR